MIVAARAPCAIASRARFDALVADREHDAPDAPGNAATR
jgi:hypothetical protein